MKTVQEVIEEYKDVLLRTHSPITVKNYISDIYHFRDWFASYYERVFSFDLLSKTSISEYKRLRGGNKDSSSDILSEQSIQRHLSSLRSFFSYITEAEIISQNPFDALATAGTIQDLWNLQAFKQFLLDKKSSDLTIKYYINDIKGFQTWAHEVLSFPENKNPMELITESLLLEYKNRLTFTLLLSPQSINRKLSSIRNYLSFLRLDLQKQMIPNISNTTTSISGVSLDLLSVEEDFSYSSNMLIKNAQKAKDVYLSLEEKAAGLIAGKIASSSAKNAFQPKDYDRRIQTIDNVLSTLKHRNIQKEFFAPHSISEDTPAHKKILHHIRHTRPKWYKEYHTYPFVHYVHFGVLVGAAVIAGFFVYNNTLGKAAADLELNTFKPSTKILSFRGRLLDNQNNPITSPTDVKFGLYTSPTEGNSTLIWEETQDNIQPDENGNINLVVGSEVPIPESLSDSETPLYLGVKIGAGEELTPRKPIGAAFASNTETVQGMLPITSSNEQKNVLLALDGSGNLSIGGVSNPTFQATGGDFTFSGETLILATNASSNGNIIISPDGGGKIEVTKALISSGTGSNFYIENLVEIEGGLGITATSSAHAALLINQHSRGDLISASTGGIAKFVVDNQGTITKGAWAGDFLPTTHGGLGGNITAATAGEILYSISSSKYGTLKAGISGQCLTSQGINAPLWSSCGGFNQINGVLATANPTLDLLIGSESTTSARFAFLNMNSGTPTFKVGSALGIDTNGLIQAYNNRDLTLGSSSTKNILLASAGNVGIGTNSPTRTLDIKGTLGGNVELYIDGQGSRTVIISGKALVYDLEKNTNGTDTDGVTTYNITGLPDTDGTIAYVYLKVSKDLTINPRTQTISLQINGTPLATVSTTNPLLSSTEIKHITILRSNNTWHIQGDPGTNNTADLAEWTEFSGELPLMGELTSITDTGKLIKSQRAYDTKLAGAVATKPAITIGIQTKDSVRLALSGRIPTIITTINGEVKAGDAITSSDIPGVGMRPTKNSPIVGKVLSSFPDPSSCKTVSFEKISWPEDDGTNQNKPCFKVLASTLPKEISEKLLTKYGISTSDYIVIGKVMMLSSLSWSQQDDFLASTQGLTITEDSTNTFQDTSLSNLMDELQGNTYTAKFGGSVIDEIGAFSNLTTAVLKTGIITSKNALISGTLAAYNIVGNSMSATTASIQTLTAGKITTQEIISPLAKVTTLQTEVIEPLSKDLTVKLSSPSSEFQIKNNANDVVARITSEGNLQTRNASVSGDLTTQDVYTEGLQARSATISGTLRASKLIADDIDGLENQVSSFATKFLSDYKPFAPPTHFGGDVLTASVSASFGTFYEGLLSLGASTFGSLTAIDQISIGTDFTLSNGGINTLGRSLELQPLRQGTISLMAGAVTIETDGRLTVSNDAVFASNVTVTGNLFANTISNIPGQDITIQLQNASLLVKNATNSAVFSVHPNGDVMSSGSGTFSKLNFNLVGQAIAGSDLEAYATSSAGTAILKAYRPELTIHNNNVTNNSLIYITPSNNTDSQVLYLLRQTGIDTTLTQGSFTVGISQLVDHDVQFNWLIVN